MYTCYHEHVWKAEKDHLEFEISKAEGQLRNCRFRTGLVIREMVVCGSLVFVPIIMIIVGALFPLYSSGSVAGNMMTAGRMTLELVLWGVYVCLFPFLVFFLVKAVAIWLINKYNPADKKPLEEYVPYRNELPEAEISYAMEEEKLLRILSIYYMHRDKMEQIKCGLTEDRLSLTPEELRAELDKLVYYEEVVPADPFKREVRVRTAMITVIVSVIGIMIIIYG